jgi:DNA polymerase III epsilon subunit-like protein
MIADEWTVLSFSAKWLDRKEVLFHHTGGRGANKVRDDREICQELWRILDNADIVITQNGKAFDMKKINARLILNGFKPYSPVRVVDTKLIAKRHFGFTSNKLAWMSAKINKSAKKDKHKKFPGFELWAECLKDNPEAWDEMRKYNSLDVISTEELYLNMRPWMDNHPNLATYSEAESMKCPRCSSTNIKKHGYARTQTGEYLRMQCHDCGGWSRTRHTLNSKEKRESLLSSS